MFTALFQIKHKTTLRPMSLDLSILVALATLIGFLTTPENPFFTGVPLHPYLFLVSMMSARYGSRVGIASAFVATLLYALGGLARSGVDSRIPSLLSWPHSLTVSGFFIFAVLLGILFDTFHDKVAGFEEKRTNEQDRLRWLEGRNQLLSQANTSLKNRILDKAPSLQGCYKVAMKLSTLDADTFYPAVLDLMKTHLKVECSSFYLLKGGALHLVAQQGWHGGLNPKKSLSVREGMIGRSLHGNTILSLKDYVHKNNRRVIGDKVAIIPVSCAGEKKTCGIIAVEEMPFEQLNQQTMRSFTTLSDWVSITLRNIKDFSKLKARAAAGQYRDPDPLIHRLNTKVREEFSVAPETNYPSILKFLEEHLKVESSSFYRLVGDALYLVAQRGWGDIPAYAKKVSAKKGMMGKAIRDKAIVSLKKYVHSEDLRDFGEKRVVTPILFGAEKKVVGVITIEKIHPPHFNLQMILSLSTLSRWISKTLSEASNDSSPSNTARDGSNQAGSNTADSNSEEQEATLFSRALQQQLKSGDFSQMLDHMREGN